MVKAGLATDADTIQSWLATSGELYPSDIPDQATELVNTGGQLVQLLDTDISPGTGPHTDELPTAVDTVESALKVGEDPNSSTTSSSAISDFRTAVGNASSPAYAGDAANDPISDLFLFVVNTSPPA